MIALFHTDVDLRGWEDLLAKLNQETKEEVIKTTAIRAWEQMRGFELDDMPNAGFIYSYQLLVQIEDKLDDILGESIEIEHDPEYLGGHLLLNLHEVNNIDDYEAVISELTFLDEHVWRIENLIPYLDKRESPILSQVESKGVDALIDEYSLGDEAMDELELDMDTEYMPQQLREAIGAAHVLKAFIDEQTAGGLNTGGAEVYVVGIQAVLALKVGEDKIRVEGLDDILGYIDKFHVSS